MNFDVFTIAAVVDELKSTLHGGRVQDSLELGADSLGLEIYAGHTRHYLLISADPQQARLHLVPEKLRRGVEVPSPLGLMLRRYIEGAQLVAIRQPEWERVVHLEFDGSEGTFTLIVEPMERRSNILLVREGRIMDCLRRVGPQDNRVRVSLPGHEYIPPPPQAGKLAPTALTLASLEIRLNTTPEKPAWRVLTDSLLGFSPLLAKEAIFRGADSTVVKAARVEARALFDMISGLVGPLLAGRYRVGICETEGQITAYAAYPIRHLPGWHEVEHGSMSEALGLFYGAPTGIEAYENAKIIVRTALDEAMEKVGRRLDALRRSQKDDSERERLRQSGELLLAYQYQIRPGQASFSAQYDFDAPALDIELDSTLTALENAKHYFEQYEKAKRAAAEVPKLIKAAQAEADFLRQLRTDLDLAANWPEIGEVQDLLQSGGYWRGPKSARPHGGRSAPLKVSTPEGIIVWVGRNARQNEEVTFGKGKPEDLWLHARGVPGAHVIIKSGGRPVSTGVLKRAAGLAAYYSAARSEGHVLVDVTERRHVRKIKGAGPGMVTYRNESPIDATPIVEGTS